MANFISWILIFVAGMAVGALITFFLFRLKGGKQRRTELVNARERILAGVKQQHEQDIRREIFQTAEALRGELNSSLRRLLTSTARLLGQVHEDSNGKKDPQETNPLDPGRV